MTKKVTLLMVGILMIAGAGLPVRTAGAASKTIIITQPQISAIIENLRDTNRLKVVASAGTPSHLNVWVFPDQFQIEFDVQATKTLTHLYKIWLNPKIAGGKVTCEIAKLQID